MTPTDRRYAKSHEWAKLEGDVATIGITAFAVEQLTEPTYLELPKVGMSFSAGDELGIIESVKSTSPIYAPVTGTVVERNEGLTSDLAPVNDDPFGRGWLVKIKLDAGGKLDHLMTAEQYAAQIAGEGH